MLNSEESISVQLIKINELLLPIFDCISPYNQNTQYKTKELYFNLSGLPSYNALYSHYVDFNTCYRENCGRESLTQNGQSSILTRQTRQLSELNISSKIFDFLLNIINFYKQMLLSMNKDPNKDLKTNINIYVQINEFKTIYKFTVIREHTYCYYIFLVNKKIVVEIKNNIYVFKFKDVDDSFIVINLINHKNRTDKQHLFNKQVIDFYNKKYGVLINNNNNNSIAASSSNSNNELPENEINIVDTTDLANEWAII